MEPQEGASCSRLPCIYIRETCCFLPPGNQRRVMTGKKRLHAILKNHWVKSSPMQLLVM